jgi:signal transduction histidine kinase
VRLIEDWLMLSRAECSDLVRRREPLNLAKVLGDTVEACEARADGYGVSLDLTLPERELVVAGDEGCLGVLFSNLVENAIRYSRQGGRVSVVARVERGEACVTVTDTGRGIAEEHRSLVFEEFFRIEQDGEEAHSGTGLGLPISRRIAQEMGGKVDLESEVGVGSTFTVRLPLLNHGVVTPSVARREGALR